MNKLKIDDLIDIAKKETKNKLFTDYAIKFFETHTGHHYRDSRSPSLVSVNTSISLCVDSIEKLNSLNIGVNITLLTELLLFCHACELAYNKRGNPYYADSRGGGMFSLAFDSIMQYSLYGDKESKLFTVALLNYAGFDQVVSKHNVSQDDMMSINIVSSVLNIPTANVLRNRWSL